MRQGDYTNAAIYTQNGLKLATERSLLALQAQGHDNLGMLAKERGDLEEAGRRYEQAIALLDQVGHRREAAQVRNNLGDVLLRQGKSEAAVSVFREALAVIETIGESATGEQVRRNLALLQNKPDPLSVTDLPAG